MNASFVEIPFAELAGDVTRCLQSGGALLTTAAEPPNTMTIGWGGISIFWGQPIFIVPVRLSRYTYELLEQTKAFTVSVPVQQEQRDALSFCGSRSGRDVDKFAACGLTAVPGQTSTVPIVGEFSLHYECRVIYKQAMVPDQVTDDLHPFYRSEDYHTFYFGRIEACYGLPELVSTSG